MNVQAPDKSYLARMLSAEALTQAMQDVKRRAESPDGLTISEVVFRLDLDSSLSVLECLLHAFPDFEKVALTRPFHDGEQDQLKLAPDYLTRDLRILVEWWFLPFLHRLKAEMSAADSQACHSGDEA